MPKDRKIFSRLLYHTFRLVSLSAQKICKVNRLDSNSKKIVMGSQWFSITHDFLDYILMEKKWIKETYKNTLCPDESFIQTLLYNNVDFYRNVYSLSDEGSYDDVKRLIVFENGKPKNWSIEDKEILLESKAFFARKVARQDLTEEFIKLLSQMQKG